VAYTFDQQVGPKVRISPTFSNCGDVGIQYLRKGAFFQVEACSSTETIVVTFNLPLEKETTPRGGSFPKDDEGYPRPTVELWRAGQGKPFLDQGAMFYGSDSTNTGPELVVSKVVRSASGSTYDIHLAGTIRSERPACSGCTTGGPEISFDLSLSLFDIQ
jgi:hypothetical protein